LNRHVAGRQEHDASEHDAERADILADRISAPFSVTFGLELEVFLSDGMDQQEADDKHHRAGYAMN